MGRVKFSSNLFLEVNELKKMVKFIDEDGYRKLLRSIINNFGIVINEDNSCFIVSNKKENELTINPGLAYNSKLEAIELIEPVTIIIDNTNSKRWIVISRSVSNVETGIVSINIDGTLSGVGTKFTEVLRGQPNFPTKVKFKSEFNTGEYEVVNVISDTQAVLSGSFLVEDNIKYQVIGTFTPGFQVSEENKFIYEYDSCQIRIIDSENIPTIASDEYIIASVEFDEFGGIILTDERMLNYFNVDADILDIQDNPLCSLLSANIVNRGTDSIVIELVLENGYEVSSFVSASTENNYVIEGKCNFLGEGNIPNGMFKGWILLNRSNMKYVVIDDNRNKNLLITKYDSIIMENSNNNLVIIPNFSEIEYKVNVSNNIENSDVNFTFIKNIEEKQRICFHIGYKSEENVRVEISYRMLNNNKKYPFNKLSIAQYKNINGISETLADSSFNVNVQALNPNIKM